MTWPGARGYSSVVEHLHSMCQALYLGPIGKNKRGEGAKRKGRERQEGEKEEEQEEKVKRGRKERKMEGRRKKRGARSRYGKGGEEREEEGRAKCVIIYRFMYSYADLGLWKNNAWKIVDEEICRKTM